MLKIVEQQARQHQKLKKEAKEAKQQLQQAKKIHPAADDKTTVNDTEIKTQPNTETEKKAEKETNTKKQRKEQKEKKKVKGRPGRESKYKTAKALEEKIEEYFQTCDKEKRPYTVTGLAYYIGLTTRAALINYENEEKNKDVEKKEKLGMIYAIKKAKLRIESYLEENLILGKQVAGTIFMLKTNYNRIEPTDPGQKQEITINIDGVTRF